MSKIVALSSAQKAALISQKSSVLWSKARAYIAWEFVQENTTVRSFYGFCIANAKAKADSSSPYGIASFTDIPLGNIVPLISELGPDSVYVICDESLAAQIIL